MNIVDKIYDIWKALTVDKDAGVKATIEAGAVVDLGAKTDSEAGADLTQGWSLIALLKGILGKLRSGLAVEVTGSIVEEDLGPFARRMWICDYKPSA